MRDADDWRDSVAMLTAMLGEDGEGFAAVAAHAAPGATACLASIAAVALCRWRDAEDIDLPALLADLRTGIEERGSGG